MFQFGEFSVVCTWKKQPHSPHLIHKKGHFIDDSDLPLVLNEAEQSKASPGRSRGWGTSTSLGGESYHKAGRWFLTWFKTSSASTGITALKWRTKPFIRLLLGYRWKKKKLKETVTETQPRRALGERKAKRQQTFLVIEVREWMWTHASCSYVSLLSAFSGVNFRRVWTSPKALKLFSGPADVI